MGKFKYLTKYNRDWENPELFPDLAAWIQPAKSGKAWWGADDVHHYTCKVCNTGRLKLSNMGVTAPRSHTKDGKDKDGKVKICKHNQNMQQLNATKKDCFEVQAPASQPQPSEVQAVQAPAGQAQVTMYLNNAPPKVLKAWILWCLDVVYSHRSYNSAGGQGDLFRKMFPDSDIADKFGNLSSSKIGYMITHGLAPYFKKGVMNELTPPGPRLPPLFVSCFDEAFNKVTYTKQMDIHILYFNETTKLVERSYLGSQFMGHATHTDTMDDFKEAHKGLDIVHNLVQLSMDGPNVNWKFAETFAEYKKIEDPNAPDLIIIGSCGVHVLHGAYQTAHGVTDWKVGKTLKAAHGIFKKSPARRSDYLEDNEIDNRQNDQSMKGNFPLKFCGHRWLENGKAITRFLEIIDQLSAFLVKSKDRKNFDPKDERFPLLLKNTSSKIFPAYCEFSSAICRDIEPFLTLFQAERPLGVFLFTKLKDLIVSLLERIVTKKALDESKTAFKLLTLVKDIAKNKSVLLPLESIQVGFATKAVLRHLTTTEKTLERTFRENVQKFVIRLLEKIVERGPLQYKFTRSMSSLSPLEITATKSTTLKVRFNSLVTELYDDKWITSIEAERAEKQYKELLDNKDFLLESKRFNINEDRVDVFYSRILDSPSTIDLEKVVRLVLIISHGNARVESGFSVNGDILLPNMLEETIVSQRLTYEGVHKAGGPTKVEITDDMMKMVRNSYKMYKAELNKKKEEQSEGQKRIVEKRKATIELNQVIVKKKAALDEMKDKMKNKISEFDAEITALQEEISKK